MRRSKPNSAQTQARGNFTPPQRAAAASEDAPETSAPSVGKGGGRLSPGNWRVPTRLNAILLIPVLVALVFGGFRVESSLATWSEAQDAERTARVVRAAAAYGQALVNERDVTAKPLLTKTDTDVVQQARAATDTAADEFAKQVKDMPDSASLKRRLKAFEAVEPQLETLRRNAYTSELSGGKTEEGYVQVQHPLMEFANELGLGTGNITSYGRTVYAVSLAKAAGSLQRSLGTHLLVEPVRGSERRAMLTALASYVYLEKIALDEFKSGGLPEDVTLMDDELAKAASTHEEEVARDKQEAEGVGEDFVAPPSMERMLGEITSPTASKAKLQALGITADSWFETTTHKFEAYRNVESKLTDKAVEEAAQISSDAKTDAIVNSAIVLVALLAAFIVAGMMARSMSRSMRRLRAAAFEVAEQRLPALVDQLSRTDPGRVDTRVEPIKITTKDEIGEVARAFDQVHREAIRLAAEQALLRGNVNAIFTNLSSRNQGLIERQLTLITSLENNEADPDQLENLFKLDHLATRMRRNGENLLILAGEEPGRRWNQPVPLVDVLRASASEVESYERIEIDGVPESEIHGQAVTDLVHLLSELLENATTFSSPHTKVRVTATRLPDGRVMIEIHDKGIGLTAEDFADINHKLANPPTVDAAISQRMGLFVVGRLANRHDIRVQLRPSGEQAGTTSLVMLPDAITHGGGGDELPDDFTVSRIVPEQPHATQETPILRSAADLGFDDSHYGDQQAQRPAAGQSDLNPIERSLQRGERRAALGAQAHRQQPTDPATGYPAAEAGYADPASGFQQPAAGYPEAGPQAGYAEAGYGHQTDPQQQPYSDYNSPVDQGGWGAQGSYEAGYAPEHRTQAESTPSVPEASRERVEFNHSDSSAPSAGGGHSLTGAGLPRRNRGWQQPDGSTAGAADAAPEQSSEQSLPRRTPGAGLSQQGRPENASGDGSGDGDGWRSANDERWQRAGRIREPKAGGVTSSGLPRRVPKANLVDGAAEQSPQGGPQVSRTPEAVRGRLSNLRRGVQQARNAGSESSTEQDQHDQQGFGPGSTYDQER
ncbi:nitrate- and nitrite sensing domain-containing protein [Streptomyces sp. SAJ15]|uniref:sensor histidine kinase n=1 Tax=Streptomyces sp. SAJ15 TaxID=2011095 RepID=UPI001184C4C1|nr:nitrate- and nitrite sensing domain-containing protein [Streptomyces sp. SAJ15]TVL94302.1 ATPase [Streptomyces sp. SAJ15]